MKFGYARVSTRDQHPEIQTRMLIEAGVKEQNIYTDHGASGKDAHRPAWDDLLSRLREGDILTITRLDRAGRSVKNLVEIAEWMKEEGIGLQVVEQDIDTTTISGRFMFHILCALAEMERDLLVERTLEGIDNAAQEGRYPGPGMKLSARSARNLRRRRANGESIATLMEDYKISRASVYRYLNDED